MPIDSRCLFGKARRTDFTKVDEVNSMEGKNLMKAGFRVAMAIGLASMASCGTVSSPVAKPITQFSVGPLFLGDDLSQIKEKLAAINPLYAIQNLKSTQKEFLGYFGVIINNDDPANPSRVTDITIAEVTAKKKIWYAGRFQRFAMGYRPTQAATLAAIDAKYGKPSYSKSSELRWDFLVEGSQYEGLPENSPCFGMKTSKTEGLEIPNVFMERCGKSIKVNIYANQGFVDELSVNISEPAVMYNELETERKIKRDAERRAAAQQNELERNRNIAPGL